MKIADVIIVGGGVMGLMTAYEIASSGRRVIVLEKAAIGNIAAASSGLTRSLRNDYADSAYSVLARSAWERWKVLENIFDKDLIVRSGCLNISEKPDEYAHKATEWLRRDNNPFNEYTSASTVKVDFPQFSSVSYAVLDKEAGLGLASTALTTLKEYLDASPNVEIREKVSVLHIFKNRVICDKGILTAKKIVIAAGLGSSEVLTKIKNSKYTLNLKPERPAACMYYSPAKVQDYSSRIFPVFAYLDKGIYGHPIVEGLTNAVKIGLYRPPSVVARDVTAIYADINDFVSQYLPSLKATSSARPVNDTDQCYYDMTDDNNFVIGTIPRSPDIIIAAGFCGTGYKFAPVVAQIVSDLTADRSAQYPIEKFSPDRFTKAIR